MGLAASVVIVAARVIVDGSRKHPLQFRDAGLKGDDAIFRVTGVGCKKIVKGWAMVCFTAVLSCANGTVNHGYLLDRITSFEIRKARNPRHRWVWWVRVAGR